MNFYGNADKAAHTRAPGKRATGKRPIGNAQPVGGQWKKKKKRKRRRKKTQCVKDLCRAYPLTIDFPVAHGYRGIDSDLP